MAFLSSSASVCFFRVNGLSADPDKTTSLLAKLQEQAFRSIEKTDEELASGWVTMGDLDNSDFEADNCWYDDYLCFSLRQDRRRLPAAFLKRQVRLLSDEFLAQHATLKFVPKAEKEQLRDQARRQLLGRTLPTPSCYDVVWNTRSGLLRYCALGQQAVDTFQGLFHQTFPGLRLQLLNPLERAAGILSEPLAAQLKQADQAQGGSALEKIEANLWLGVDLLLWLTYRTLNSDSRYAVNTAGPLLDKQPFSAYLDNRLVLIGGGHEGVQKIVVAGPQDHYREVKTALSQGKQIAEATLHMELNDEQQWRLTLKGDRFQFANYRTPMIRPENDPDSDPQAEREAAFWTKLGAVEEGEQLFDSLLNQFLQLRLTDEWLREQEAIQTWLSQPV